MNTKAILSFLLASTFIVVNAQTQPATVQPENSNTPKIYLGVGFGMDYGILGGKIEYVPIKNVGVFAGIGYDLLSLGWNIGGSYKILPDKKFSPNLLLMYGVNGVFIGGDSYTKKYEMKSYGLTAGVNFDIKLGRSGNTLTAGLLFPIHSTKYNDNFKAAKNDPNIRIEGEESAVAFSIGFNFRLQ